MFKRNKLSAAIVAASAASIAAPANAALEEIIVTATKRAESSQDVAVAVTALGGETMSQFGITNFEDYMIQLPGVTGGGSGPGQNTIYIRGLASTTPNLTTAGVAGLAPNVAFYLDEQPISQPGRNLDVYTADMSRAEVLAGPQGTLFGASSQAGTVRLITNKPNHTEQEFRISGGTAWTDGGEESYNGEIMVNVPVTDQLAIRGVLYHDLQGGYIDNVAGLRDVSESARFRAAGTVRSNGVPVSAQRGGFQQGADLSGVTFLPTNNANLVDDDINDTTYSGGRLSASYDINEDWSLLVAYAQQRIDSDGVFQSDPTLDDYEIQRYEEDRYEDRFRNTAWTLTGRIADLDIVYTGGFTDREVEQRVDYSDYLFVGQYLPYYICDGTVTYPGGAAPAGTCQPPNLFVKSATRSEFQTHEVRISTPAENDWRVTAGAFFSDFEMTERNDFSYPGNIDADVFGLAPNGENFADNFPYDTGFVSDPGPFPRETIFRNDVQRTDEQMGFFAEGSLDLGPVTVTLGARYYDIEVDFEGSANGSFCNSFAADAQQFGTDISDLYNGDGVFTYRNSQGGSVCVPNITFDIADGQSITDIQNDPRLVEPLTVGQATQIFNALRAPDTAQTDGFIFKANVAWNITDDAMVYWTVSEGFRPGLLNRPGGATNGAGYTVPFDIDTDEVTNYEFGWKTELFDRTLRFNGNIFYVEVDDLQTTIFDPSIVNLFFSDNAANAEILGLEGDFTWIPAGVDGLTISGAFSFLDTEVTDVLLPTNDVNEGDELAFAPEFQGNLRARYEWFTDSGLRMHVMPHVTYSDESFSDIITINRDQIDSWVMVGFSMGVAKDTWAAEIYADNVFDEQAELARTFINDRERVTYARPRTIGLRLSYEM